MCGSIWAFLFLIVMCNQILSRKQVANKLKVCKSLVGKWIRDGILKDSVVYQNGLFLGVDETKIDCDLTKNLPKNKCKGCSKYYTPPLNSRTSYYRSTKCATQEKICEYCKTTFVAKRDRVIRFCSNACAGFHKAAIKLKEDKICEYCGGEYRGVKEQKYCCEACKYLGYQETLKDNSSRSEAV
jgi:hypothetical protein